MMIAKPVLELVKKCISECVSTHNEVVASLSVKIGTAQSEPIASCRFRIHLNDWPAPGSVDTHLS